MAGRSSRRVERTLVDNGLDFVLSALRHLSGSPGQSDLKYAVLHLSAGIDLILKARLHREHWSLVFESLDKANSRDYERGTFVSANFHTVLLRLQNVCGLHDLPQHHLKRFREKRNRLEHFGLVDSREALIADASHSLSYLIRFIDSELGLRQSAVLDEIRSRLSTFDKFVEDRTKAIEGELAASPTAVIVCFTCDQIAAAVYDGYRCLFCGRKQSAESAARSYVGSDDEQLYECPSCASSLVVMDSFPADCDFLCFKCGEQWYPGEVTVCGSCNKLFEPTDSNSMLCAECAKSLDKVPVTAHPSASG
jgi:hypothetical protein